MRKFMNFDMAVQKAFADSNELACFSKLMLDTAKGVQQEVTKEQANQKIRERFFSVLGVDENASRRELRRAIRRNRVAVFEIIEDTIDNLIVTGWQENPFFREFVEEKNIAEGDTNEFYIPDASLLTISKVSGGHHDLLRQKLGAGTLYSVPTQWYGVKIYEEYEIFMANRIDWAGFINKLYSSLDQHVNNLLYAALRDAGTKLPAQTDYNKTGVLDSTTKENFLELIENVEMATGKDVVIMGTRSALSKVYALSDVSWISNDMKQERNQTGKLGIWEGIEVAEIPQALAQNSIERANAMVNNSKIYIMPKSDDNKMIKLVYEGDSQIREISDGSTNMDMTIEYEYQTKLGVAVVVNMLFGVYTITQ